MNPLKVITKNGKAETVTEFHSAMAALQFFLDMQTYSSEDVILKMGKTTCVIPFDWEEPK